MNEYPSIQDPGDCKLPNKPFENKKHDKEKKHIRLIALCLFGL